MSLAFTYPGRLPGMNEIVAAAKVRHGPGSYAAMKRKYTGEIALLCQSYYALASPVAVMIDWFEPNEKRDPDNIMAGQKFILDAMVAKGVLEGDGPKHIKSLIHRFHVDAANPRVVVEVYEV